MAVQCNTLPFSALTLLVGRQGHLACKKLGVGFFGANDLTEALHVNL